MQKLILIIFITLSSVSCKSQEQVLIEPCVTEFIPFNLNDSEIIKEKINRYMSSVGFTASDKSKSIGQLFKKNILYLMYHDEYYLDLKKGGFSVSIENLDNNNELQIVIFNSKNKEQGYCQHLISEIVKLLQ